MTAGIDGSPGYRHGDLVTVAGDQLVVFHHEDQWVEATPPGSAIHVTVHQNQIEEPLRIGSLFTGFGGLDQAAHAVFGGELAWVCDNHPSAVKLLEHRHPDVPNLGDITAIDWEQVERVAVLVAGFPCTDISNAGQQAGIEGAQSGLWSHVVNAIRVLRPRHVLLENVSALLVRGLDRVAADLATLGYDLRWVCLRASDIGAPHRRDRWFGLAVPSVARGVAPNSAGDRRDERRTESARIVGGSDVAVGGAPSPDAHDLGRQRNRSAWNRSAGPADHGVATTHADSGGQPRHQERDRDPHGTRQGEQRLDADRRVLDWGQFEPAIRPWEAILGRPAPEPTELSAAYLKRLHRRLERRDKRPVGMRGSLRPVRVLSPRFVEWLMGIPAGWVTDVPGLSRAQQLRLLGNGVVPQQGEAAIRHLFHLDALTRAA